MKSIIVGLIILLLAPAILTAQLQVNGDPTTVAGHGWDSFVLNDTVTGTTLNLLAKVAVGKAIKAGTGDTAIETWIVTGAAGTTLSAQLAHAGQAQCIMDATNASGASGWYVIASTTTAGRCHAQAAAPNGWVVGTLFDDATTSGSVATVIVSGSFNLAGAGSGTVTSVATSSPLSGGPVTSTGTVSCPTCVFAASSLTDLGIVIGTGGAQGSKTVAGLSTDGVSIITHGVAGASVGEADFKNLTSGTIALKPVTGALGSSVLSLPAATDTLVARATTDTLSNKTLDNTNIFNGFHDVTKVAAPANPASGSIRLYADSTSGNLSCLTSAGANCIPGGGIADPGANGYLVRTSINTTVARTFAVSGPVTMTNLDGTGGNSTIGATINACQTFPASGAYTPSGTANTRECLGSGTYTLPTSVTTLANNGFVIYCAPGTLLQRGSGASGLKFTGTLSGPDSCLMDDGGFTSTARFVEITGNDSFAKNNTFQNHSATSSAFPTIDVTGSATRVLITNNTWLGTQVDPCISINSARTASGTITGTIVSYNRVNAFGPTAATNCISADQLGGSTVTDTKWIGNEIFPTTSGATSFAANGQVVVQNAAFKGWVINNNSVTQGATGGTNPFKLFGPYNGQAIGNAVDLNGHAVSGSAFNMGDLYDFNVDVVVHGGGNENALNCVDCENNSFHFVADNGGGGLSCFTGSSSSNPFSHNVISGICRMSANAVGVTIKGNASGKPANYNKVTNLSIHCNGNANSTGVLFDIGNSATGLNNEASNITFDGCSGSGSVDINVNNSAMTGTRIGPGISYDSGDTKSLNDSGTTTQFADTNLRTTLNSSYTNATTTFSSVTGLAFPIAASQTLTAKCTIIWQGSAGTTGPKYQFTGPASPTSVAASAYSAVTATTFTQSTATAFSSSMANTGTITTATNFVDTVTIGVLNGTTSGTVQLQAAANGTGTLTIQPGSYCTIQ